MQLQIFISGNVDKIPEIISRFMDSGISGTTIIDCEGALQVLGNSNTSAPAIFGSLRQFLNADREQGKLMLTVLQEEQIPVARQIIYNSIGDINKPGAGILFTIPINNAEGLVKQKNEHII